MEESNLTTEHLGKGTVWMSVSVENDSPYWRGYWDLEPDGPPTMLEQGPGWHDLREAILWGRERSSRVFVRLDERRGYWFAGSGVAPEGDIEGTITVRDRP